MKSFTPNPNRKLIGIIRKCILSFIYIIFLSDIYLFATPVCQLITQNFSGSADGATSDPSATGWSMSTVSGATYWACQSRRIKAQGLGAVGTWSSAVFNILGRPNVQVEVKISAEGILDTATEYIAIYYKLNGGSLTLIQKFKGNRSGSPDVFSVPLNGSTVQIVVQIYTKHNGLPSYYYIEGYGVNSQVTGCSLAVAPSVSGTISCTTPSVTLSANSNTTGATFAWTGPNGFTSILQNPNVTAPGTYNVTATIAASSSTTTGAVTVTQDKTPPSVGASVSGSLSCSTTSVKITGSSSTSGATFYWTGPNNFTSTLASPSVTAPGTYNLTVTNPANGCTSAGSLGVSQNNTAPGASASVSGSINCANSTVTLTGSSETSGVTYIWSGTNGLKSTLQNPTVSASGIDTLTVTNPSNGCKSLAAVTVIQNKTAPDANASANGSLTCSGTSVTLNGSSSTSGVTYSWSGPNSFSSTLQSPSVSSTGTYMLTVTNPANGCTSTASAMVTQNTTVPGATASSGGTLTCSSLSISLSGSSGTSGVSYSWAGPGNFTSTLQNPSVTTFGTYTLTVTNPTNGCMSTATESVTQNITVPGATAATSGPLTCSITSVTLQGSSPTSGVTYGWSGSNGLKSTLQNPTISSAGIDTLTVTDPTNGCKSIASVSVIQNKTAPGAAASVNETLTCSKASVTLNGSSSISGVSYNWYGPSSFSSTIQNPSVNVSGTYTLTVTDPTNGCTSTASAIVTQNKTAPDASATGGALPCSGSIGLSGFSSATGATYNWSGPGNFTSNLQNPLVNSTGTYTLTVTNPANGCNASDTAIVVQGIAIPGVSATAGQILTCTRTSVTLYGTSGLSGVSYSWTGPNGFTSTLQNPLVNETGIYTLTVSNLANGCTSSDTAMVNKNTAAPGATALGGKLTCGSASVALSGSSGTSGVTYSWSGPNGFNSTLQNPIVNRDGNYNLTVKNPINGCSSTAQAVVTIDTVSPGVSAEVNGILTCSNVSVTLYGSSGTSGIAYHWAGPAKFSSSAQNPVISVQGTYTLTVSNPENGCVSNSTVAVNQNITKPGVAVVGGGTITCAKTSVALSGSSATSGVTYNWNGPGNFNSTQQNISATVSGKYLLTVIDPANGCSSKDSISIDQNTGLPGATASTTNLTCTVSSATVTGNSGTSGVTYNWSGPNGFISNQQSFTTSSTGTYNLTVTDPVNGCISAASVVVSRDIATPDASASAGMINCSSDSALLSGSSLTPNVFYSWSGPNGFNSEKQSPTTKLAGAYTLIVKSFTNGCTSIATATVSIDKKTPGAAASVDEPLSCAKTSVVLSGNSSTSGVTFNWSGPNNFASLLQNPFVSSPGTYTLTVKNPVNGCTSQASVDVAQIVTTASASASVSGTLTCSNTSVTLTGNSTASGVSYAWTGPNGFTSASQNPVVTAGGVYTLTVTNALNGCSSTATINVEQNNTPPGASAFGDTLTCMYNLASISGYSDGISVGYNWSGPGNYASTMQSDEVSTAGKYILTVLDSATGCTSTDTAIVVLNTTNPAISASTNGSLSCTNTSVTLTGSSTTSGALYNWAENSFSMSQQNTTVTDGGTYTLTVTNPLNGCSSTASVHVAQNSAALVVTATGGTLTCKSTSAALAGSSDVPSATYRWTGPGSYSSSMQNPTVTLPGIYILSVTNPANDCVSSDTAIVLQDATKPGVEAIGGGVITCSNTSVSLAASSPTGNTSFTWGGFTAGMNPISVSSAGTYYVTATNNTNGCISVDSAMVTKNVNSSSTYFVNNSFTTYTNGTLSDNGATGWYLDRSHVPSVTSTHGSNITPHYFALYSNRITAQQLGGEGIWYTQSIDVSGIPNFQILVKISCEGTLNSDEYAKLSYKLDGGSEISWDQKTGNFGTISFKSPVLNANSVKVIVRLYNYGKGGSTVSNYYIEKYQFYVASCGDTLKVYPYKSGTITCASPSVTLSANPSHSGATYQWTGPNGYTSTLQNPVVTSAGTYTVKATIAPSSVATGSVTVTSNLTVPGATAGVSSPISCSTSSVTLSGSSGTSGVSYSWSGPNSFKSSIQNPVINTSGTYILTATNPVNGCTSNAQVTVLSNVSFPDASASFSGAITCAASSVTLSGSSTVSGVTYNWTGPGSFTSTSKNPAVSVPGAYKLTVTNPANGCSSKTKICVLQNTLKPGARASVCGRLTCKTTSLTLSGRSCTRGVNYSWTGPNGFTSTLQRPAINSPGTYYLTVTNPVNGCTSQACVTVKQDITMPSATANVSETLTCTKTSVILSGQSSASCTLYKWTGPNGFISMLKNPSVKSGGTYTLTVISLINSCKSQAQATVLQDTVSPGATVSVSGQLNCTAASVTLSASSTVSGATYHWTGPNNFNSYQQNLNIGTAGDYYVLVTSPSNGCTAAKKAIVSSNFATPLLSISASDSVLTSSKPTVTLTASSVTPNTTFTWRGFADNQNPIIASAEGYYSVTATDNTNGCTRKDSIKITNGVRPLDITIAPAETLTCAKTRVNLTATTTVPNTTITWTGFPEGQNFISVSAPGKYIATVRDNINGNTKQDSIMVIQDIAKPNQSIAVPNKLTCATTSVSLNASSTTSGATFAWTGYTAGQNPVSVSNPDKYYVTATNPANGCTKKDSVTVTQDITKPNQSIAAVSKLTCSVLSVSLNASSTTPGATFAWTGYTAGQNPVSTANPGKYYVTATNPANGCTKKDSIIVTQDIAKPNQSIAAVNKLTCSVLSVSLNASSTTPGATFAWTGYTAGQNPVSTANPGKYYVTATNPANGCTKKDSVTVTQDITKPDLSVAAVNNLTCTRLSVSLNASSATPGATFAWTGFTAGLNPVSATNPGKYYVTATNPANGCTKKDSASVLLNVLLPNVSALCVDTLTCFKTSVALQGNSNTPGAAFYWTGPSNFISTEQRPVVSQSGVYTLTVIDPANGCTSSANTTVNQDTSSAKGVNITRSGVLNCTVSAITLTAGSSTKNVTFSWAGPNNFSSFNQSINISTPGNYILQVLKKDNGCLVTTNASVALDTVIPKDVAVKASGIISCTRSSAVLTGSSSTNGVTYSWVGPGFSSSQPVVTVTNSGSYFLTVTNPANNCFKQASITVIKDLTPPAGVAISVSGALTCSNPNASISVTTTTQGVVYAWTGPINFISNERAPQVNNPGIYSVIVTNPYNDCSVPKSIEVLQNKTAPEGVQAYATDILTCSKKSISLNSSSSTSPVTYSWMGPTGFTSSLQYPVVNMAGIYKLTVTSTANGCTTLVSVSVNEDKAPPKNISVNVPGALDCNNNFVTLSGSSGTAKAEFLWTGPDGSETLDSIAYAIIPGAYKLIVTNPGNGCKDSVNTVVFIDTVSPVSHIIPPAGQPTALTSNLLSAQVVNDASYLWAVSFPNPEWYVISGDSTADLNYHAGDAESTGTFVLTVTSNRNGCSRTSQVTLTAMAPKVKGAPAALSSLDKAGTDSPEIKVYPNPFADKAFIEFTPSQAGNVTIDIYSSDGSYQNNLFRGVLNSSHAYKVTVNSRNMKSGMYYVIIRSNREIYSKKLIIMK